MNSTIRVVEEPFPCIIPARGGSVRIPHKNLQPFCGKPLVVWSIEAALNCKYQETALVFVSTDDDEIAKVAVKAGAQVIRRDWISPASEPGTVPIERALHGIEERFGHFQRFMTLLPTGPCRAPGDLDRMVEQSNRTGYWATIVGHSPKETTVLMRLKGEGAVSVIFDKGNSYFQWTGGDCFFRRPGYEEYCAQVAKGDEGMLPVVYGVVELAQWQCQDVDTPEQWEVAEYWFKRKVIDVYGEKPYERS